MSSVITSLLSGGAGQLTSGIAQIINSIKGRNPEDAAKLQELVTKHEDLVLQTSADLQKTQMSQDVELNQIASDNYKADAQSTKPFQAYARPAIIWVGLTMCLWNFSIVPTIGIFKHGFQTIPLPDAFMHVFQVLALGTVMTRSADKVMNGIFGGSGGEVKLPFGIAMNSKGE